MNYTVDKTQKHPYIDNMHRLYKDGKVIGWIGVDALIERKPGPPTVAPESDKRPVYDRLAETKEDFA